MQLTRSLPELTAHWLDQFQDLGPVTCKRLFGGYAFYLGPILFAVALRDVLYFRVDATLKAALIAEGSTPFTYEKKGKQVVVQKFYTAPDACLDDPDTLMDWARQAIDANRTETLAPDENGS
ncbi:MAG: TfoX/Sxy family protein [Rhodospirillaceae bacterium]